MRNFLWMVVFLLPGVSYGAASVKGDKVYAPYKIVEMTAEGDIKDAAFVWRVRPRSAGVDPDVKKLGGKLYFTAPPGSYTVELLVIRVVDGKPVIEEADTVVTIGGTPPTPTPPGPGPTPPPTPDPDEALGKTIRDAWAADTTPDKASLLVPFVNIYARAAKLDLTKVKTGSDYYTELLRIATEEKAVTTQLVTLRSTIAKELKKQLPEPITGQITDSHRTKLLAWAANVSVILGSLK